MKASQATPSRRGGKRKSKTTDGYDPFAPVVKQNSDEPKKKSRFSSLSESVYTAGITADQAQAVMPELFVAANDDRAPFNLFCVELEKRPAKFFVIDVPLEKVKAREGQERQVRSQFDKEELEQLTADIKAKGVIAPPELQYDAEEDVFWIETGERRTRAATLAGLKTYNAYVYLERPKNPIMRQLAENLQRSDLDAFETLDSLERAIKELEADGYQVTVQLLADELHRPRSFVQKHLNLSNIEIPLRDLLRKAGILTDFQYMDTLRKIWDGWEDIVRFALENSKELQFNRNMAVALLKQLKTDYAEDVCYAFKSYALRSADQVDAAVRYLGHEKANRNFFDSVGETQPIDEPRYLDYALFELEYKDKEAKAVKDDVIEIASNPAIIDEEQGSAVEVSQPGDPESITSIDTQDNSQVEQSNPNPTATIVKDSSNCQSIDIDPGTAVISGKLKGHGLAFLVLDQKDSDPAFGYFIRDDRVQVRAKLSTFSIQTYS